MARAETIIIDVQVNAEETAKQLSSVVQQIEDLKKKNADLKKQRTSENFTENTKAIKENELQIKALQSAEKDLTGVLANSTAARRVYSDSFRGQAAQLADLKNQYSSLSKQERESAGGQEMLKKLAELDKQVKENDKSMGNFQRNVGNYPTVFDLSGTSIGKFSTMLQGLGGSSQSVGGIVSGAFTAMKTQAVALGKAFLTPPVAVIAIVLGAIVAAASKVSEAFKKNDEAATKLARAMSVFKPVMEGISWLFDKLAVGISNVVLGISKFVSGILSVIPAYKKAAQEADLLVIANDNLEQSERNYVINSAWRNKEIARLKKEAVNTQKYSTQEIKKMLELADSYEKKNLEEYKWIQKEKLRIMKAEAKQRKDTSDATEDAIARQEAAVLNAEENYYSGTLRLATKANSAAEKQQAERDARLKAAKEKREKLSAEELKQKIDELAEQFRMEDEIAKSFERIEQRKIDALKAVDNVKKLLSKSVEEEEADITGITKYLEDVKKAKEEIIKAGYFGELELQMQKLTEEYNAEIANAKKINADTTAIEKAYSLQRQKIAEEEFSARLGLASGLMSNLSNIFGEQTELGKAAAAAQIAIETYKGAMAAYSQLAAYPPLAIAAAAAVGVVGAKKIKDVYAVDSKFADGGIVQGTSFTGDNLIARVNSGEMIFNTEQQKKLFRMIAHGNNFSGGMDYELLAKAISKQPAPVLVYKEFGDFQRKISTFDEQIKI